MKRFWSFLLGVIMIAYAVMAGSLAVDTVTNSFWYDKIKERRKNKRYSKVEKPCEEEDED